MHAPIEDQTGNDGLSQEERSLIEFGEKFGETHNLLLSKLYDDLIQLKTRTSTTHQVNISYELLVQLMNKHLTTKTRANSSMLTADIYKESIEEIRSRAPLVDLEYIDRALATENENKLNNLILELVKDESADLTKEAVLCFITTYKASLAYWRQNENNWNEIILNRPQTRISWGRAAFADAWWGYQGLLMSGANPIVGAGAAAVASAGSLAFD